MKQKIVGLMLVKSQSTRLPNKNTLDFHGEPMYFSNLRKCLSIFDKVYISSDADGILELAKNMGAIPIKRPIELCGDTPNIDVYKHAMKEMICDAFVAVQANSPTVHKGLIYATKKLIEKGWNEVMTCHEDYSLYGSIWAMTRNRLGKFSVAKPEITIVDESIDIHTEEDYQLTLKENE